MHFQDARTLGQKVCLFFKTRTTPVVPEIYARIVLQESTASEPERCANNYTLTCVKRDVLVLLDAFDGERSYEIYPGFTLFQSRSSPPPEARDASLAAANSAQLDQLIIKRLNDYAESIDFRVKLINPINRTARSVGTSILERVLPFLRMSKRWKPG